MQLKEYLKSKNRAEFAAEVGTTLNYINNICTNPTLAGKALALRIEQATGGAVSRLELLYPEEHKRGPAGQR